MGCDGGTIPKRDELIRTKPKEEKASKKALSYIKALSCALSKEALKPPIVCDKLGNIFNKESLLQALLLKNLSEGPFAHIRSIKDLTDVHFTPNPSYSEDEKDQIVNNETEQPSPFICSVTGYEFNGQYRFSILLSCGHVFTQKALREIPSKSCLECGTAINGILPLIPDEEQQTKLLEKLKQAEAEKKTKASLERKRKREERKESPNTNKNNAKDEPPSKKKRKLRRWFKALK